MQFYQVMIIYYTVINLVALAAYGIDKRRAVKGKWRIPERMLIFLAFLGGGIGALFGMKLFHHKTKKKSFRVWIPLWMLLHIILVVFCFYQNNHLVVTYYNYDYDGIDCRIVQISDLHNVELWFDKDYVCNKVAELEPDIIVVTGDVVDSNHTDIASAINTMEGLAQIADTYYVTGNHEYLLQDNELADLCDGMRKAGVRVMFDETIIIDDYGQPFVLIGIDDKSLNNETLKQLAVQCKTNCGDGLEVVLAHEPQYMDAYTDAEVDLVLAGHAHGGQFIFPFIGAVVAPNQGFFPQLTSGSITKKNTTMIISRGLGNSVIPVRVFNYPEIVVIDIFSIQN